MKWNKFTLKTRAEMEDIVIAALAEAGVQGVEIEDRQPLTEYDKQQMFVDILPDMPEDDGVAYLNFYLEPEDDKEQILADVKKRWMNCRNFWIWENVRSQSPRQRTRTGSITGRRISSSSMWTTF